MPVESFPFYSFITIIWLSIYDVYMAISLVHFILGCSNRCIFDSWDFILDHRSHRISLERLWRRRLLSFISNGYVILNWVLWLRILCCISDNRWVRFDSGLVHWNFLLLFIFLAFSFFFAFSFLISLLGWFFGTLFLSRRFLCTLLNFLCFMCFFFWFFFCLSSWLFTWSIDISLHIFCQGLD